MAYYALRRTKVRNARGRVAVVLNRFGYKTRAKPGTDTSWTSAEVNERVRQYEARIIRQHRLNKGSGQKSKIKELRDMQIDGWIHGFHSRLQMKAAERDGAS